MHSRVSVFALQVRFQGQEDTVDAGGPTREFWRLFVEGVVAKYCIGEPGSKLFLKDIPALQVSACKL